VRADGRVQHLEALVRWQHPTRGLLGPDAFIAAAEALGVMPRLGAIVLDTALRDAAAGNRTMGGAIVGVHVNLSAAQLLDADLVSDVAAALARHDTPAGRLTLELTESVLLGDTGAITRLHDLVTLGVGIALDDFGTGYSSLSYLSRLPVDMLKSTARSSLPSTLPRPTRRSSAPCSPSPTRSVSRSSRRASRRWRSNRRSSPSAAPSARATGSPSRSRAARSSA
jgi:EAL domain-containing protein (putative c-di-GMP-specific phosphodiesterase class I)